MMKTLIILAQFHSLSGEPVHNIPAFSWENPGWSEGSTSSNATHHNFPNSGSVSSGSGSVPASRLNNDFGNMD
jgi:hypothetical protein